MIKRIKYAITTINLNITLNLKVMKKIMIIFFLLFTFKNIAQVKKDTVHLKSKNMITNNYSFDYFEKIIFKLGTGILIPQGNLNTYFGVSPLFEVNMNFPIKNKKSIELVLQFAVPHQKQSFRYIRTIDTLDVTSKMMINFFINFKKNIYKSSKSSVNLSLGIGASTIRTDARNPSYTGKKEEEKYEMISSILLSPGINWQYEFSPKTKITFGFNLQYAPYKIEGALRENIGSLGIIPKILYTF